MLSDDDTLGIYDDLDEFQQAEDHKSKELLAWEVKHRKALAEIEDLKARNKALEKKMKTMEVNLQNLLDTAKSEVKRKEVLIGQLRKEKDDICFRRKRGREVEEPAEKEPENKRLKAVPRVDPEVKKNPFKADSKSEAKPVAKRRSRSKSPRSRSKIQEHGSEIRRKSRERRRSRSRSPRHSSRQEEHRSRGGSSRRRSRSPLLRAQVSASKLQKLPSLPGDDTTSVRESGRKPHHERAKKLRDDIAAPLTLIELNTPQVATEKTKVLSIEREDTSAFDGYLQGNTPLESNNPTNESSRITGTFVPNEVLIPGLDTICEAPAHDQESSAATSQSEGPNQSNETLLQKSVLFPQEEEPKSPDNNAQNDDAIAIELSKPVIRTPIRNSRSMSRDSLDNGVENGESNRLLNKLTKDHDTILPEVNADILVASGTAQRDENMNCSSAGSLSESKSESCDVGIRIIEDIRLPEVADIGHIAVIVDELCDGVEEVTKKHVADAQKNPSGKDVLDCSDPRVYNKGNGSLSELKQPTTPSIISNVFYAQPDSTKVDHNDTENGVMLEAALNLLVGSDPASPPQSAPNQGSRNLSLEEDAIEKALGQLHQTSSPDETVVTSTSNRARKTEDNCAPTSTFLSRSRLQPGEPEIEKTPPKMDNTDDSQSQVSRVLELEPPSPSQDITIDETVDDVCISNEDLSTVTKRCSLGHTDYQFEQRNDEIILRVKRRTRRARNPPTGGKPD